MQKPAWLANVAEINSPELTAAIKKAEQAAGNPEIITDKKVVRLALAAVAEAM